MKSPFWKGLEVVLLLALGVGVLVFITRILGADVFSKEEAQHGLYGLWIMRDLRGLDWGGFWYDTGRQLLWPFLHSWILGLFFLFFGVSYVTARFLSLIFFVLSIVMIYYLSSNLSEKSGWKIGIVASILALTSPLLVAAATRNLLESMGMFLFLSCAALYVICEERRDLLHYILLTVLFGLAIYTNYLFAFLIIPSFIVVSLSKLGVLTAEVADLTRRGEDQAMRFLWWAYRKLIILAVLLSFVAVWFSFNFSRKVLFVGQALFKYSGGRDVTNWWQGLLYYPQIIINRLSFSPWLGALILLALFLPFIAARMRGLNRIYVYAWTPLLLATLFIPNKLPQIIVIATPFMLIIAAAGAVWLWELLLARGKRLATIVLVVGLLPVLISLPALCQVYFPPRSPENIAQVLDFFKASVPRESSVATGVNLLHLSPEVILFHFHDWRGKVLADTLLDENELMDGERYFLTVELDPGSPCNQIEIVDDSLYVWNNWLKTQELAGRLRLAALKRYENLCLTAKVYYQPPSY